MVESGTSRAILRLLRNVRHHFCFLAVFVCFRLSTFFLLLGGSCLKIGAEISENSISDPGAIDNCMSGKKNVLNGRDDQQSWIAFQHWEPFSSMFSVSRFGYSAMVRYSIRRNINDRSIDVPCAVLSEVNTRIKSSQGHN